MFTNIVEFFFGKPRSAQTVDAVIKISAPTATTQADRVEDAISTIANNPIDKHKAEAKPVKVKAVKTEATPAKPAVAKTTTAKPKVSKPRAKKQGS
jgi:hypothetical protein